MKKALIVLSVVIFLLPVFGSQATVLNRVQAEEMIETVATSTPEMLDVPALIKHYASQYKVSAKLMLSIVTCETAGTFDPSIQSYVKAKGPNGREDSWGLSQIHLPSWPKITREQAQDPHFALNFLAEKLSKGQAYLWSCYNNSL